MTKKQLLLIEQEKETIALIKLHSGIKNYHLYLSENGDGEFEIIKKIKPNLVLLNIMLPRKTGLDICSRIKKDSYLQTTPIILLSPKQRSFDIVAGLELGADDYIEKPFSMQKLFCRIEALTHQKRDLKDSVFIFGDCLLDTERYILRKEGNLVPIDLLEFWLLHFLLIHRGKVLTSKQILQNAFNNNCFIIDQNVDVLLSSLRKKLGSTSKWIETIDNIGYRFTEELSTV